MIGRGLLRRKGAAMPSSGIKGGRRQPLPLFARPQAPYFINLAPPARPAPLFHQWNNSRSGMHRTERHSDFPASRGPFSPRTASSASTFYNFAQHAEALFILLNLGSLCTQCDGKFSTTGASTRALYGVQAAARNLSGILLAVAMPKNGLLQVGNIGHTRDGAAPVDIGLCP